METTQVKSGQMIADEEHGYINACEHGYINACKFLFEKSNPMDYQKALFKHSAGMELNEDEGELLTDLNSFFSLLCS